MSRPFSYNDENFTVIGNLLFIHFRDDDEHGIEKPVIQIPPSIYERMVTNSFVFFAQLVGDRQSTGTVAGTTVEVDGKHFIAFLTNRAVAPSARYYIGFSQMKDI